MNKLGYLNVQVDLNLSAMRLKKVVHIVKQTLMVV